MSRAQRNPSFPSEVRILREAQRAPSLVDRPARVTTPPRAEEPAIRHGRRSTLPPGEQVSAILARKGERRIWQWRFWEHSVRDDAGFAARIDDIHDNPVKHRWVAAVGDWPYSTFHRYVRLGVYASDWGGGSVRGVDWEEA